MSETVTINFSLDRNTYNRYKSIVAMHGENVKGNLIKYMQTVIQYGTPNAETIEAMKEADEISRDPNTKRYASFAEILAEVNADV